MSELVPAGIAANGLLTRTFSSLRNRNYRLFFIGQLISNIGSWMQRTAEGWLIYQLTSSELLLGTVSAAAFAPMFFLSMFGGVLADRYSKRHLLIVTQVAATVPPLAMAILILGHRVEVWHIIALAALSGVVMAFDMPVRQAFVIDMVGEEDLLNAISLNSAIFNGARMVGPAIAGYLMAAVGIGHCYLINAISFLAVVIGLIMMELPKTQTVKSSESAWRHALGGFAYLRQDMMVAGLFAMIAVVGMFGFSYQVLMPVLARDVFGVKEQGYGFLTASSGVGALVGSLLMASLHEHVNRRGLIFGGVLLYAVSLFIVSVTHSFPLALVSVAVAGCGLIACFSTTNTLIQMSVPDAVRGRVMGIWALVIGGVVPISSLQAGTFAHYLGVGTTLQISAGMCALAAVLGIVVVNRRSSL